MGEERNWREQGEKAKDKFMEMGDKICKEVKDMGKRHPEVKEKVSLAAARVKEFAKANEGVTEDIISGTREFLRGMGIKLPE